MDLFFIYTSRLCQVVAAAAGVLPRGVADSPLLPAINILLQWIATNPASLRCRASCPAIKASPEQLKKPLQERQTPTLSCPPFKT